MSSTDAPQSAQSRAIHWKEPTRLGAAWHGFKVRVHIALRACQNAWRGPRRLTPSSTALTEVSVVAESRSGLWLDGREDEFILRCGKVQNLRVAIRSFDGVVVRAGEVLSFWAQVGRPSAWRGFAVGREIINGCVVPTVGGGLCQISNALASAAVSAGVQLVERHRHSALIEQQSRLTNEDATVAWNYVDLRLVADFDFRIEMTLTHDELQVRLRAWAGAGRPPRLPRSIVVVPEAEPGAGRHVARGCLTCGQTSCFRNERGPHA
jgi:hypothetical protein